MTATFDANNHQSGVSYDANGNSVFANNTSSWYTVENKMMRAVPNVFPYPESRYGYDPSGKRVMKSTNPDPNNYEGNDNPTWEFYFYLSYARRLAV